MDVVCEAIEFEQQLATLRRQLKDCQDRFERELVMNQSLRSQNAALAQENTHWRSQLSRLQEENEAIKWRNAGLYMKAVPLETTLKELKECNESLARSYMDLLSETGNACRTTYAGLYAGLVKSSSNKKHVLNVARRAIYEMYKLIRGRFPPAARDMQFCKCSIEAQAAFCPAIPKFVGETPHGNVGSE